MHQALLEFGARENVDILILGKPLLSTLLAHMGLQHSQQSMQKAHDSLQAVLFWLNHGFGGQ